MEVLSTEELRETIIFCLSQVPPDDSKCLVAFTEWHKREPDNVELLEDFAEFLLNAASLVEGRHKVVESEEEMRGAALDLLTKAIEIQPDSGAKKYWYLSQITQGEETAFALDRCLQLLLNEELSEDVKKRLIECYLAIAELYMTDLCDVGDAQERCETALDRAKELNENDLSVKIARAVYSRIIGDLEDAVAECKGSLEIVVPMIKKCEAGEGGENLPEYETQLNLARLCVDIGLHEEAVLLLEFLIAQNDDDDRVWHRLALAEMICGNFEQAMTAAESALHILNTKNASNSSLEEVERLIKEIRLRQQK